MDFRLRMATRHQPQRSSPEDCSARVELVQVESPPLAAEPDTLPNQQYESVEFSPLDCGPTDNDLDQYATPLDMERRSGEYEMPLVLNARQDDLSEHSGQNTGKTDQNPYANTKPCKSPAGKSKQDIKKRGQDR